MSLIEKLLLADAPPNYFGDEQKALWWVAKGNFETGEGWNNAHKICSRFEGQSNFDAIHALLHLIEKDDYNFHYWQRHSGHKFHTQDPKTEWERLWDKY